MFLIFLIWQNKSLEVDCFRGVFFVCALKSTHPGLLKISGLQEGVYTFQMTVTDTAGQKSSDNISVTVLAPKHQAEGNELTKTSIYVMQLPLFCTDYRSRVRDLWHIPLPFKREDVYLLYSYLCQQCVLVTAQTTNLSVMTVAVLTSPMPAMGSSTVQTAQTKTSARTVGNT